jgi:hypothetical protein
LRYGSRVGSHLRKGRRSQSREHVREREATYHSDLKGGRDAAQTSDVFGEEVAEEEVVRRATVNHRTKGRDATHPARPTSASFARAMTSSSVLKR